MKLMKEPNGARKSVKAKPSSQRGASRHQRAGGKPRLAVQPAVIPGMESDPVPAPSLAGGEPVRDEASSSLGLYMAEVGRVGLLTVSRRMNWPNGFVRVTKRLVS
jgi:hypothetical protein